MADNRFFRTFDIETGGLHRRWFLHRDKEAALFDDYNEAIRQFELASQDWNYALDYFIKSSKQSHRAYGTTYFGAQHHGYQIFQIYSPQWQNLYPNEASTWIQHNPVLAASPFAVKHGFVNQAQQFGNLTEAQAVGNFYTQLSSDIAEARAAGEPLTLAAWNPLFDISALEAATRRLPELDQYQGFFAKHLEEGSLRILPLEEPFLEVAKLYGQQNPEFATKFFRDRLTGVQTDNLRRVKGWSVENLAATVGMEHYGLSKDQLHWATADVPLESKLYEQMSSVLSDLRGGTDFKTAFAKNVPGAPDPAEFFSRIYGNDFADSISDVLQEGQDILGRVGAQRSTLDSGETILDRLAPKARVLEEAPWNKKVLWGLGLTAAASIAYGLAFSRRSDRQTQITGLYHGGMAEDSRREHSDFGSGYRGLDEDSPSYRTALGLTGIGGAIGLHHWELRNNPKYTNWLYQALRTFEEKTPGRLGRTFDLRAWFSAYTIPTFSVEQRDIRSAANVYTPFGEHLQRIVGDKTDLRKFSSIQFQQNQGQAYHSLVADGVDTGHRVRFAERGRFTAASARWHRPLQEEINPPRVWEFSQWRKAQYDKAFYTLNENTPGLFHPVTGFNKEHSLQRALDLIDFHLFAGAERLNQTLSLIGMGLRPGQYNSLLGIRKPLQTGKYAELLSGGMVPQLLLKRVLPAYLGYQGLRWLDYKLGHAPSNAAANIVASADIFRADLTDKIPGFRSLTDKQNEMWQAPAYAPLALPIGGAAAGALYHYFKDVVPGGPYNADAAWSWADKLGSFGDKLKGWLQVDAGPDALYTMRRNTLRGRMALGAVIGGAAALLFLPKMLGSAKTGDQKRREYSGEELVPLRASRWWETGTSRYSGDRIKYFRPNWYQRFKSRAEQASLYGSEEEYWKFNNPITGFFRKLTNPYHLEEIHHDDRPYPVTSPAFSNVPLIGSLLAATIGKWIKPVKYMHEGEWSATDYQLYGEKLEPKGPDALPPPEARSEFDFEDTVKRELKAYSEMIGLPGFIGSTAYNKLFGGLPGEDVFLEGSRQMESVSRRYYEKELGSLTGPEGEGYTEPIRRLIQREDSLEQVNGIPNTSMPSWLPGDDDDYFINFRRGDAFTKVAEGYARLPGAGYEALHPEVRGVNPEDYPDITKLRILADVAPYSRKYTSLRTRLQAQAANNLDLQIEIQKIADRVHAIKESTLEVQSRRFTGETETLSGTIKKADLAGVELEEYPGQKFKYSSVGLSAADLSAIALGESNALTKEALYDNVRNRRAKQEQFLQDNLAAGTKVSLVVPGGTAGTALEANAVFFSGGDNLNAEMIDQGIARSNLEDAGPEAQAMYSSVEKLAGKATEGLSFTGDHAWYNPLRYIPTPYHTKLSQVRDAWAKYLNEEVYGSRFRPWDRPIEGILKPWFSGMSHRLTGESPISDINQEKRDLHELTDKLTYLRGLVTGVRKKSLIGSRLDSDPSSLTSALSDRERKYLPVLLQETDPGRRDEILSNASPELGQVLAAQWLSAREKIAAASGKEIDTPLEDGRLVIDEDRSRARETGLTASDVSRAREIAEFFASRGIRLPETDSEVYSEDLDYEDVKAKILEWEGRNMHDFGVFQDRQALLWRKPYLDGAVRELTSGENRSVDELQRRIEMMIKNSRTRSVASASRYDRSNVRIDVYINPEKEILEDIRHNRERYD